eukprot:jgi/Bigna1/136834/aug1.36_g11542
MASLENTIFSTDARQEVETDEEDRDADYAHDIALSHSQKLQYTPFRLLDGIPQFLSSTRTPEMLLIGKTLDCFTKVRLKINEFLNATKVERREEVKDANTNNGARDRTSAIPKAGSSGKIDSSQHRKDELLKAKISSDTSMQASFGGNAETKNEYMDWAAAMTQNEGTKCDIDPHSQTSPCNSDYTFCLSSRCSFVLTTGSQLWEKRENRTTCRHIAALRSTKEAERIFRTTKQPLLACAPMSMASEEQDIDEDASTPASSANRKSTRTSNSQSEEEQYQASMIAVVEREGQKGIAPFALMTLISRATEYGNGTEYSCSWKSGAVMFEMAIPEGQIHLEIIEFMRVHSVCLSANNIYVGAAIYFEGRNESRIAIWRTESVAIGKKPQFLGIYTDAIIENITFHPTDALEMCASGNKFWRTIRLGSKMESTCICGTRNEDKHYNVQAHCYLMPQILAASTQHELLIVSSKSRAILQSISYSDHKSVEMSPMLSLCPCRSGIVGGDSMGKVYVFSRSSTEIKYDFTDVKTAGAQGERILTVQSYELPGEDNDVIVIHAEVR